MRRDVSRNHPTTHVGSDGPYDFSWQLSGDRASAPLQVFSTPDGVWLQFSNLANVPAIFGQHDDGRQTLVPPRTSPPYVFIPGVWQRLVFRVGGRTAYAAKSVATRQYANQPYPNFPSPAQPYANDPHTIERMGRGGEAVGQSVPRASFRVERSDGNLRRVLARWASLAGWTFEPEHWSLDADIPVSAEADLGDDFRTAARRLMAATEMGDVQAQPCFYANKVLRVVAFAQQCDPRGQTSDRLGSAPRAGVRQ